MQPTRSTRLPVANLRGALRDRELGFGELIADEHLGRRVALAPVERGEAGARTHEIGVVAGLARTRREGELTFGRSDPGALELDDAERRLAERHRALEPQLVHRRDCGRRLHLRGRVEVALRVGEPSPLAALVAEVPLVPDAPKIVLQLHAPEHDEAAPGERAAVAHGHDGRRVGEVGHLAEILDPAIRSS